MMVMMMRITASFQKDEKVQQLPCQYSPLDDDDDNDDDNYDEYHSILSRSTSSRTALSIFSTLDDDEDNDNEYDEYDEYHSIL